jgi:xylan 1,4-beta-xylosidase
MYSSYTAASFARLHDLASKYNVNLEGALTWAFEFENQPYFAGFRSLASNGLDKPVLNVFRMFSLMGPERVFCSSDSALVVSGLDEMTKRGVREKPDVSALATRAGGKVAVLVWHYHDDDLPGPDAEIELIVRGLTPASDTAKLRHFRIDQEHSNAFTAWQKMGSPQNPTSEQYSALQKAGQLALLEPPKTISARDGIIALHFLLPRQAVSLLVLE